MKAPVRIAGIGTVLLPPGNDSEFVCFRHRLETELSALSPSGRPPRLVHRIEEVSFPAALEALRRARCFPIDAPERIGIALGVEEGIDGIKADHFRSVLREGPVGTSPLLFPLTAPNAVAARLSILLDLRGENHTLCGGILSGAQALGVAIYSLREGACDLMLAGGVTSIGPDFRDGYRIIGTPQPLEEGEFACIMVLTSRPSGKGISESSEDLLLGYGEATGRTALEDAVGAALEESRSVPGDLCSIVLVSDLENDEVSSLKLPGIRTGWNFSGFRKYRSASVPLAVRDFLSVPISGESRTFLVAGVDCDGRSSAIVTRQGGEGRKP